MQSMEKNVMNEISKKFEEVNSNMQLNMQLILKAVTSTGQVFSPPQFSPSYAPSTRPLQTPSPSHSTTPNTTPNSTSSTPQLVKLKDLSNKRIIAEGFIEPVEAGTVVHNRRILEFERKVNVVRILGDDNESLYLDVQGCATTIGEVLGGFVVWPIYFIQF
ncbi:hypothetical protein LguiA_033517 [Lonicera macranthoides]